MSAAEVDARSQTHELALLLEGRCRRCAERLPGGTALRGEACPHCGEPTAPGPAEQSLLAATVGVRATTRFWVAAIVAAGATLIVGWLPLLSSLLLAACMFWMSVAVVKPSTRMLSRSRRLVSRWTLRLAAGLYLALSLVIVEALTLVPIVGVPVKAVGLFGQVVFAGFFARSYLGWQAEREARREPIGAGELALVVLATLSVLVAGAVAAAAVAWVFGKVVWLQSLLMSGGTP